MGPKDLTSHLATSAHNGYLGDLGDPRPEKGLPKRFLTGEVGQCSREAMGDPFLFEPHKLSGASRASILGNTRAPVADERKVGRKYGKLASRDVYQVKDSDSDSSKSGDPEGDEGSDGSNDSDDSVEQDNEEDPGGLVGSLLQSIAAEAASSAKPKTKEAPVTTPKKRAPQRAASPVRTTTRPVSQPTKKRRPQTPEDTSHHTSQVMAASCRRRGEVRARSFPATQSRS